MKVSSYTPPPVTPEVEYTISGLTMDQLDVVRLALYKAACTGLPSPNKDTARELHKAIYAAQFRGSVFEDKDYYDA